MGLLEREAALACMAEQFEAAATTGRLVLVSGEAGVGKTTLVEAFCAAASDAPVLIGRCDDLFAPRPLGPLADIARGCGGDLRDALLHDDREAALDAFLDLLTGSSRTEVTTLSSPVIAVIEDLQWADEATLDMVRLVARRLPRLQCLVIATYRDDVDRDHPLQLALGDLVQPAVARIHLDPLSVDAVQALAADSGIDPVALHAATGGNPFFVTEVSPIGTEHCRRPSVTQCSPEPAGCRLTPGRCWTPVLSSERGFRTTRFWRWPALNLRRLTSAWSAASWATTTGRLLSGTT